jgi:uncharacterized protein YqkB
MIKTIQESITAKEMTIKYNSSSKTIKRSSMSRISKENEFTTKFSNPQEKDP